MTVRVPYTPAYRSEILRLVGRSDVPEALWRWQYESNPRDVAFNPVMVCTEVDGPLVGFNGVMPVTARYNGEERSACWSCDFHVQPEWRGSGAGRKVKEELHADHSLLMTFGVSPVAARVLPRLGWQRSEEVVQYRRVQVARRWQDRLRQCMQWVNRIVRGGVLSGTTSPRPDDVTASSQLPDSDELDALWRTVAPGYSKIVCRDAAYLYWRYGRCPVAQYGFLALRDSGGRLRALAVFRHAMDSARLVDLVAAANDVSARRNLVAAWLRLVEVANTVSTTTSDRLLGKVLLKQGFFRVREQPGFFVRSSLGDSAPERGWFIMPGDSDGDFLQAAKDAVTLQQSPDLITTRCLLDDEWLGSPAAWQNLIEQSSANPLFMGWAWQSAWWQTWGQALRLEACVVAVFRGEELIGLLPLFRRWRRSRTGTLWRELHVIGHAWSIAPTVRTEYVSAIVDAKYREQGNRALTEAMTRLRWDIFTVCDTVAEIGEAPWECVPQTTYLRRKREQGVVVTVDGEFTQWLQALGPNTRLKVYNRRNYLEQTGRHAVYREESNAGQALELLNHFHMQRWGKPAFEGASLRFHQRLLERLGGTGKAHCTVLEVDGQAESLLYDVIAGSCAYNLQAGFNEQFDSKVSLGTLHLGYTLEDAFANTAVTKYDLLAGSGKNTFYKRHFRGQVIEFDTWQLARHPLLRMGYGAYRLLPGVLQRVVVRLLRPGRDSHEAQA